MHSRVSTMKRTAKAAEESSKMLPRGITTRSKARAETQCLAASAGKLSSLLSPQVWSAEDVQPLNDSRIARSSSNGSGRLSCAEDSIASAPGATAPSQPAAEAPACSDIQPTAGRRHPASSNGSISSNTSNSSSTSNASRRVSFGPGPLSREDSLLAGEDGHPVGEGSQAVPVRRVPASYALDLTRGNVLMLENLLGQDCSMSITRLKRRVGLLPPIRAPRPHVGPSRPQQAQQDQDQEPS